MMPYCIICVNLIVYIENNFISKWTKIKTSDTNTYNTYI